MATRHATLRRPTVALALLLLLLLARAPQRRRVVPQSARSVVLDVFAAAGFPRAEADAVIRAESGWNAAARNKTSDASGLIQMLPSSLRAIGWPSSPAAFRELDAAGQAPWIARFLRPSAGKWRVRGDTYLALAAPKHVGAPDELVIYPVGSAAWRDNRTLRSANDGPITAGSIRARVTPWL